ncbi:GIDE domain-containing protein [Calidifontibacter terrae]
MTDSGNVDAASRPLNIRRDAFAAMLEQAHSYRPAEAGGASDGRVVKVIGKAQPGPAGPLRAPLSGKECVWYRSFVLRGVLPSLTRSGLAPTPFAGLASSDGAWQMMVKRRPFQPSLGTDRTSTTPFTIGSWPHTISIDPTSTDVMTEFMSINKVVDVDSRQRRRALSWRVFGWLVGWTGFSDQELHTEWIIPIGAEITGVGSVARNSDGAPRLTSVGDSIAVASTYETDRLLSRLGGRDRGRRAARMMMVLIAIISVVVLALTLRPWTW